MRQVLYSIFFVVPCLAMPSDETACAVHGPVNGTGDLLFLHGFGDVDPLNHSIYRSLRNGLTNSAIRLHAPCYHPARNVHATRLEAFLEELRQIAESMHEGRFAAIVGFSVGGLLAALFQERHPKLVGRVVLLAPAVDNFARNFEGLPRSAWWMPPEYVEELRRLPARPEIKVPVVLIHGSLEDDSFGSAPWRIQEWTASEPFEACFYPDGVGHSPGIVGASGSPAWDDLIRWAIDGSTLPAQSWARPCAQEIRDGSA